VLQRAKISATRTVGDICDEEYAKPFHIAIYKRRQQGADELGFSVSCGAAQDELEAPVTLPSPIRNLSLRNGDLMSKGDNLQLRVRASLKVHTKRQRERSLTVWTAVTAA
jgi:hypothetical protein